MQTYLKQNAKNYPFVGWKLSRKNHLTGHKKIWSEENCKSLYTDILNLIAVLLIYWTEILSFYEFDAFVLIFFCREHIL